MICHQNKCVSHSAVCASILEHVETLWNPIIWEYNLLLCLYDVTLCVSKYIPTRETH